MSWDAGARRVSPTAPFDASQLMQLQPAAQPNQTSVDGTEINTKQTFGNDGNATQTLAGMKDGQAINPIILTAMDAGTQCNDAVLNSVRQADVAIGKQNQTLQVSKTTRQQAAQAPRGTTFESALNALQTTKNRLTNGIKDLEQQVSSLQLALGGVPADDPRAVQAKAKITEVRTSITALKTERRTVETAMTGIKDQQAAAASQKRTSTLTGLRQILDTGRTPQEKAGMLDATAKQLSQQGAAPETVKVLQDMAKSLRGEGVYRGQVTGDLTKALKKLGNGQAVSAEKAALQQLVGKISPTLLTHAKLNLGTIPQISYFRAATDENGVARNATITQKYKELESVSQKFLGPPAVNTWFYMAQNASGEVGKALDDKTACVMESPWIAVKAAFKHLPTAVSGAFDDALKAGNREIYNTIAPAAAIFFKAEAEGKDGVEALLASDHFRNGLKNNPHHPTYADTDKLVDAFRYLQRARRSGNEEERAGLVSKFNKNIADYEQRQVLQPILDADPDIRSYMKTISSGMAWTRPDGKREALLPNGGDWGNADTRLKAIGRVSDISVAHQIAQRRIRQTTQSSAPQRPTAFRTTAPLPKPHITVAESTANNAQVLNRIHAQATTQAQASAEALAMVQRGEKRVSR